MGSSINIYKLETTKLEGVKQAKMVGSVTR